MASKRDEAAGGEPGACGGWRIRRIRRGVRRLAAE